MKGFSSLLFVILLWPVVSCSDSGKTGKIIKAVEKTDSCSVDPKNTYEVYIPERNNSITNLPLLVIIDAHGSGKFALNKFKQAANQYPVILVASNQVKNGFVNYQQAIQVLIGDVKQKYPAGETVFLTGFSGGARMALGYAKNHQLNGLILCGALGNADQIKPLGCPVISISGTNDFNFRETVQYLFQEELIPENLRIVLTNESHNWPDSLILKNTFGFLYLSSQTPDIPSPTKSVIKAYCQNQQERIDVLKGQGEFLKATLVARNMSLTEPFNNYKVLVASYNSLKNSSEYSSQLNKLKSNVEFEMSTQQPYMDAFNTKDTIWWNGEIESLMKKISTEKDPYSKNMYQRIKGFLGILCYLVGNHAVMERNSEMLNKTIFIYCKLEPENPQVLYFSAFPSFWNGNDEETISLLNKALEAGFSDMYQLRKDFPETITSKLD